MNWTISSLLGVLTLIRLLLVLPAAAKAGSGVTAVVTSSAALMSRAVSARRGLRRCMCMFVFVFINSFPKCSPMDVNSICLASALLSPAALQIAVQEHYTLKSDFRKVPIGESAGFRGIGDEAASGRRPKAVWKVFKNALFAA